MTTQKQHVKSSNDKKNKKETDDLVVVTKKNEEDTNTPPSLVVITEKKKEDKNKAPSLVVVTEKKKEDKSKAPSLVVVTNKKKKDKNKESTSGLNKSFYQKLINFSEPHLNEFFLEANNYFSKKENDEKEAQKALRISFRKLIRSVKYDNKNLEDLVENSKLKPLLLSPDQITNLINILSFVLQNDKTNDIPALKPILKKINIDYTKSKEMVKAWRKIVENRTLINKNPLQFTTLTKSLIESKKSIDEYLHNHLHVITQNDKIKRAYQDLETSAGFLISNKKDLKKAIQLVGKIALFLQSRSNLEYRKLSDYNKENNLSSVFKYTNKLSSIEFPDKRNNRETRLVYLKKIIKVLYHAVMGEDESKLKDFMNACGKTINLINKNNPGFKTYQIGNEESGMANYLWLDMLYATNWLNLTSQQLIGLITLNNKLEIFRDTYCSETDSTPESIVHIYNITSYFAEKAIQDELSQFREESSSNQKNTYDELQDYREDMHYDTPQTHTGFSYEDLYNNHTSKPNKFKLPSDFNNQDLEKWLIDFYVGLLNYLIGVDSKKTNNLADRALAHYRNDRHQRIEKILKHITSIVQSPTPRSPINVALEIAAVAEHHNTKKKGKLHNLIQQQINRLPEELNLKEFIKNIKISSTKKSTKKMEYRINNHYSGNELYKQLNGSAELTFKEPKLNISFNKESTEKQKEEVKECKKYHLIIAGNGYFIGYANTKKKYQLTMLSKEDKESIDQELKTLNIKKGVELKYGYNITKKVEECIHRNKGIIFSNAIKTNPSTTYKISNTMQTIVNSEIKNAIKLAMDQGATKSVVKFLRWLGSFFTDKVLQLSSIGKTKNKKEVKSKASKYLENTIRFKQSLASLRNHPTFFPQTTEEKKFSLSNDETSTIDTSTALLPKVKNN